MTVWLIISATAKERFPSCPIEPMHKLSMTVPTLPKVLTPASDTIAPLPAALKPLTQAKAPTLTCTPRTKIMLPMSSTVFSASWMQRIIPYITALLFTMPVHSMHWPAPCLRPIIITEARLLILPLSRPGPRQPQLPRPQLPRPQPRNR